MRISKVICCLLVACSIGCGPVERNFEPTQVRCDLARTVPSVYGLKCEYKTNTIGIDVKKPRLSWKITSYERAIRQSAYQIRAAESLDSLTAGNNLLWDSGKVPSERSIHVLYEGVCPVSRERVYWQVRIWDNHSRCSGWSEPAFWEMGLINTADWEADWIEPNLTEDPNASNPCPMLRKEFVLDKPIKSARAYVTSLGLYQMELNGCVVGDELFTPGWTAYRHRLQYQTYDVTGLLKEGRNCIGVTLGDGWYRGRLAWEKGRNVYGEKLALLAQIEVVYQNGSREVITSDRTWRASTGPILMSDIYNGEVYDGRLEIENWNKPGFDEEGWSGVTVKNHSKDILVAPAGPAVRRIEELKPNKIFETPAGQTVIDMGQNMVGWVRFKVTGPAGTRVMLQHAEVLDVAGNLYIDNLRDAKQTDEYILKGDGEEVFEPHFTFHGFRYVDIEGWPGELSLDDFSGVVIHSDIKPTGTFECSDSMINQLQHNINWGLKGNFLDVPTDCPQRDERLGWTGDAQVFARTACFNADVAGFYTKWLADLAADQQPSGAVPHVIPNVLSLGKTEGESASAGWADAATVVPWTVYLCYGDTHILEQQYESMKAWVDYVAEGAGETCLWKNDSSFGDWLAFSTDRSDYPGATTDKDLVCQAYFARSTDLLQRTAKILGKMADSEKYTKLLEKAKKAFRNEFITPNGRLASNTQTAYSLALAFDLVPSGLKETAAKRLAKDVNEFKHITTGFLGTPLICHILTDHGYLEYAYDLLNRKEYPSWLYPIDKGATTIWERWDGIKPDGTFQDKGMNSFNHYAYGAIGEWLYRVVAGIEIDEQNPGYKHIIIQPHPGGELTYAKARLDSMYGPIESGWNVAGETINVNVEVPANTSATIRLPDAKVDDIQEGGKPLDKVRGIVKTAQEGDTAIIQLGSGRYLFEYPAGKKMIPNSEAKNESLVTTKKVGTRFLNEWQNPPLEFSQAPFWFWNDRLSEEQIIRQIDDFQAHGVYGFVIHPRVGLPRSTGWMSERMIHFMRIAIEQAIKRGMWVVLYDEGMYPSGSSSGQVVAENPAFRTRGLFAIDLETAKAGTTQHGILIADDGKPELADGQYLVATVKRKTNGHRIAVFDRAIQPGNSVIRGLHFVEEDPPRRPDHKEVSEDTPPAADILNPEAVECFIRLVYQRYFEEFGEHFGQGIRAIFTDEPSLLARKAERGAVPGTTGILEYVNSWLGYDFTPYLPTLWYKNEPNAERYRRDYYRALQSRLDETFYVPISKWCNAHGIALTGHPDAPDDIGHLRHFHIPGQDVVWRHIEPGKPSALEGPQSTQAKCASSAMIHLGRRRNSNEYCGAYGHSFTFEEMKWLTNWLVVRGCNMLYPHAFYYSVRGPRIDERPPDVGPNSPWWEQYKPYADACRRLCWLNTDSKHVCALAILGHNDYLPWRAAKICFQNQRDFNYIEARHLWEDAKVTTEGIQIAGMNYRALIVEDEPPRRVKSALKILNDSGRVIRWEEGMSDMELVRQIDRLVSVDVRVSPSTPELRVRHVVKYGTDCYVLFNEGQKDIDVRLDLSAEGQRFLLDMETGNRYALETDRTLHIPRNEVKILMLCKP